MSYDAYALSFLIKELKKELVGGKLNKISQPDKDTYIFSVYAHGKTVKLLASCSCDFARLYLTKRTYGESLQNATGFLMNMRKHLTNAEITDVIQPEAERIVIFVLNSYSELRDKTAYRLCVEIMGRYSNIVLCGENNIILSASKQASLDVLCKRHVFSGLEYTLPEKNGKPSVFDVEGLSRVFTSFSGGDIEQYLMKNLIGLSRETVKAILFHAYGSALPANTLSEYQKNKLLSSVAYFAEKFATADFSPVIEYRNGVMTNVYPFDYNISSEIKSAVSLSEAFDCYYGNKTLNHEFESYKKKLIQKVKSALAKNEKKRCALTQKVSECEKAAEYKRLGEIILNNIYKIKQGDEKATLTDYVTGEEINVTLEKNLSPSKNAEKYFKKFNKLKSARTHSQQMIASVDEETEYLTTIADSLEIAENMQDLDSIKTEIKQIGLISDPNDSVEKQRRNNFKNGKKVKPQPLRTSCKGFEIFIGKNNVQNDFVTFELAAANDLWLHVRQGNGSHVIIKNNTIDKRSSNEQFGFPKEVISTAAAYAAYYSSEKSSESCEISYCLVKNVKKPKKAALGYVTYSDYKSIFVKPLQADES